MPRVLGALLLLLAAAVIGLRGPDLAAQPLAAKVLLVRHAEPLIDGSADPGLSPAGLARAQALAAAVRDAGVTAILTSDYRRTRETAQPAALALGLSPVIISARGGFNAHITALTAAVRGHRSGAVLVVGHSDTVPILIAMLGGPPVGDLCQSSFDRLFTLTLENGQVRLTRSRYGQPSVDAGPDCP